VVSCRVAAEGVGGGGAGGRGTLRSVSTIRSLRLRIPTLVSRSASRAPGPASADGPADADGPARGSVAGTGRLRLSVDLCRSARLRDARRARGVQRLFHAGEQGEQGLSLVV
jgi:hypothetical protein